MFFWDVIIQSYKRFVPYLYLKTLKPFAGLIKYILYRQIGRLYSFITGYQKLR